MTKPYAKMDDNERWLWHSEIYAFRRVMLGLHEDDAPNPCDPNAQWIDEGLIGAAMRRLQAKRAEIDRRRKQIAEERVREGQRAGRNIVNRWAQAKGHADLDAYCAATGQVWVDVYTQIVQQICATSPYPPRVQKWRSLADRIGGGLPREATPRTPISEALGVTAQEIATS